MEDKKDSSTETTDKAKDVLESVLNSLKETLDRVDNAIPAIELVDYYLGCVEDATYNFADMVLKNTKYNSAGAVTSVHLSTVAVFLLGVGKMAKHARLQAKNIRKEVDEGQEKEELNL